VFDLGSGERNSMDKPHLLMKMGVSTSPVHHCVAFETDVVSSQEDAYSEETYFEDRRLS
jgi:hypothetical protein